MTTEQIKIAELTLHDMTLNVFRESYRTDPTRTAITVELDDGEPFIVVSVNVASVPLAPGEFIVHHDLDALPPLVAALKPLFIDTGRTANYGYVTGRPIWRLKEGSPE